MLIQIASEADFVPGGWWLDWGAPPSRGNGNPASPCPPPPGIGATRGLPKMAPASFIPPPPVEYAPVENRVRLRNVLTTLDYNNQGTLVCNLHDDDAALVGRLTGSDAGEDAPIVITFGTAVRAVGAYATATGAITSGLPYFARMWVRLTNTPENAPWPMVSTTGVTGTPTMPPAPRGARFLGARATEGDTIQAVAFDMKPTAVNLTDVVISQLYVRS